MPSVSLKIRYFSSISTAMGEVIKKVLDNPEIHENIVDNTTNNNYTYSSSDYDYSSNYDVETTQDTSQDSQSSTDSYSEESQSEGQQDAQDVNSLGP